MNTSGQTTLSEARSKQFLSRFGVKFAKEIEVMRESDSITNAVKAAEQIGFPVVVKLCGDLIAHKTERGLVRLAVKTSTDVALAAQELLAKTSPQDGEVSLIVASMESGKREFIAGVIRDPQFGLFVMIGLGGIYAEILGDVAFAPVPLTHAGALDLQRRLKQQAIFQEFRGEKAVSREQIADVLVALSNAIENDDSIASIDINPILVRSDGSIVAVDALVVTKTKGMLPIDETRDTNSASQYFDALFNPRAVVVVGASTATIDPSVRTRIGFISIDAIESSFSTAFDSATNTSAICSRDTAFSPRNS